MQKEALFAEKKTFLKIDIHSIFVQIFSVYTTEYVIHVFHYWNFIFFYPSCFLQNFIKNYFYALFYLLIENTFFTLLFIYIQFSIRIILRKEVFSQKKNFIRHHCIGKIYICSFLFTFSIFVSLHSFDRFLKAS